MKIHRKEDVTILLEMSEDEAKWLKQILKNAHFYDVNEKGLESRENFLSLLEDKLKQNEI